MTTDTEPVSRTSSNRSRLPRLAVEVGLIGALLLVALVGPGVTLAAVLIGIALVLLTRRPEWSVPITLVLGFTTFPGIVPVDFTVAGYAVHAFEPFLVFALVWSLLRFRAPAWANVVTLTLIAAVVLWAGFGVLQHNVPAKVIFDIRPFCHMIAAQVIAARLGGTPIVNRARRLLPAVLWFSAIMTILASTTGFAITGSSEQATLYLGDATSDATRLRGPTTDLALITICACLALFVLHRTRARALLTLVIPSFLIVFLAFSRYTVLGIGFALVFSLLAARSARGVFNAALLVVIVAVAGISIGVAAPRLAGLPGGAYLVTQVSGFQGRVLGGLTGQVIAEDGSAQFRLTEDAYLTPNIEAAPFIGHGFGFAYKPPEGTADGVFSQYAPYYAHNWYLWILAKTGILGTSAILAAILLPVALTLLRPRPATVGLATALGTLMVDSVVAPMPNGDTTAALVGLALGLLLVRISPTAPEPKSRRRTRVPSIRPEVSPLTTEAAAHAPRAVPSAADPSR